MDKFIIRGGKPLRGTIATGGSKNAALPILIASLLTDEPCVVRGVPRLRDIVTTLRLLEFLGKRVVQDETSVRIYSRKGLKTQAPYDLVKQMRASVLVAGPLLARFGGVRVPLPGGCAIGLRPIDLHLKGFEQMGAKVSLEKGDAVMSAGRLHAARIALRFASVGATENLLMAASLLERGTTIENAAREPEIADLAVFLRSMGAQIEGEGTGRICVRGRRVLRGAEHNVIADRIEAGTFLIACAATRGSVFLQGARPGHLRNVLKKLQEAGCKVQASSAGIGLSAAGRPNPVDITTRPYPGFPTDLQAPWMALMSLAKGQSMIRERIFEKRFLHAGELARLGARLSVDGDMVCTDGVGKFSGAMVMASDIRAGAALLVAGLAAGGKTEISRIYHIDRGYEAVEKKLRRLGADIIRVKS
ncbi:MAG: UDP-N-acetylglucosamine 1-carboxyvinyltransferase [Elusimicrobia bacterium]|nr:UDP-N-acetylglucosamine 1-carboxyvinyltransferase [Elusimicrobiota bacterium]